MVKGRNYTRRERISVLFAARHTQVPSTWLCWISISRARGSAVSIFTKLLRKFWWLARPETHWPGEQCAGKQSALGMSSSSLSQGCGTTYSSFSPLKLPFNSCLLSQVWLHHSVHSNQSASFLSSYLKLSILVVNLLVSGMLSSLEFMLPKSVDLACLVHCGNSNA